MANKRSLDNLFERLRKKLGNPTHKALQERIRRRAVYLGLTSKEAIFVLAQENKISYLKALKTLSLGEQSRITGAIQSFHSKKTQKRYSRSKCPKPVILKTKFGIINEPFLPPSVKKDAKKVAEEAYLVLYIFENSIRNFINKVLEENFGSDWWSKKMTSRKKLSEILNKTKHRMKKEKRKAWHGKRGNHPIYYSDFPDLILILENYEKVFNKYFKNQKRKVNWLLSKLEEIEPSRNVVAHHNPLSERDFSRVVGNLMDWIKQLEFIKKRKLL